MTWYVMKQQVDPDHSGLIVKAILIAGPLPQAEAEEYVREKLRRRVDRNITFSLIEYLMESENVANRPSS